MHPVNRTMKYFKIFTDYSSITVSSFLKFGKINQSVLWLVKLLHRSVDEIPSASSHGVYVGTDHCCNSGYIA